LAKAPSLAKALLTLETELLAGVVMNIKQISARCLTLYNHHR